MECSSCGATLDPHAAWCAACGAPASVPAAASALAAQSIPPLQSVSPVPEPCAACGTPQTSTNLLAIVSLVMGIVWAFWIGSLVALVTGAVAKGQIRRSGGAERGASMATAGVVLGWIGAATFALTMFLLLLVAAENNSGF